MSDQAHASQEKAPRTLRSWMFRLIPVAIILLVFLAAYLAGFDDAYVKNLLSENRISLRAWLDTYPLVLGIAFALFYATMVGFSLPVASVLTLIGGLLFGAWWGFLWSFLGAMGGATAIYLVARYAFADALSQKADGWVGKLEKGFRENEFSFMLMLRLIIIVPFVAINVAAGILNVRLHNYIIATAIGIIPATLLKTFLVAALSESFWATGEFPSLNNLLADPRLWVALVALALIAVLPIIAKRFAGNRMEGLKDD